MLSEGRDRYERLLGKIYLDGRDINREMVREGHAWAYRRYLTDQSLLDDERRAREAGAGLWSLPLAQHVPPWEWRRGERRSKTPAIASAPPTTSFACGRKTYCREMTSCAEALFYLRRCGLTRIDGDGDGVPCEKICRGSTMSAIASAPPTTSFTCGGKTYCREMTSCAEALFYLRRCGLTRIDGDGDGVPCEKICRGSR